MWESVKRLFGGVEQPTSPAAAIPTAVDQLPEDDDLPRFLSDLTTRLHTDSANGRSGYEPPPISLAHRLNGGSDPGIARYYAGILTRQALPDHARILDLGCGYGRIALELATRLTPEQQYIGLDPHADAVAWASANITPAHPNLTFARVDIESQVYNAEGTIDGAQYRFPFADASLDLVTLISVMTHVDFGTVTAYVREAARTLAPTGRLVATFFLLDDEVDRLLAEGRSEYTMRWPHGPSRVEDASSPELAIAHPRALVLRALRDAGFAEPEVAHGHWSGRPDCGPMDYQDLIIAPRSPAAARSAETAVATASPVIDPAAVQRAADRLRRAGITSGRAASDLLTWANPVVLNALWWQDRGLDLALIRGDRLEPVAFAFPACRALGFDVHVPEEVGPDFTAVSPHDLLGLIVDAGQAATPEALLACAVEVAEHGFRIRTALEHGDRIVLVGAEASPRTAPLPPVV
ncbi:class I SAM-dependent methyltransferase [Leucobacter rhizosphaerae]|uniref:Class I SAM-dependent methyltransferase n=1 Tax=Leucobacter rhizosphaerae TaxID=2932245 RepID=A0ABY4FZN5_9MICO|nr:class I SAM-dependent methyltransferase [Leucobacter rhizosphaerae]UOQ61599.1 class I SAM-dependent methyltransferase [Leucobacter rhizosphaerae]